MNGAIIPICELSLQELNKDLWFIAQLPKVNWFYYILYRFGNKSDFVFKKHMRKHAKKKITKKFYRTFCESSKKYKHKPSGGKEHAFVKVTFDQKNRRVIKIEVLDVSYNN